MTALVIILAAALLIFLILCVYVRLIIVYDGDIAIRVAVLFLRFPILPKKREKIKLSDYSIKAVRKRARKAERAKLKKKPPEKAAKKKQEPTDGDIHEILDFIKHTLGKVALKSINHIHCKLCRMKISVATGDAASTAILYGAVVQSAAYIIEAIDSFAKLTADKKQLEIKPDYTSKETSADIRIVLKVRVHHVLAAFIRLFIAYVKNKEAKESSKNKRMVSR